MTTPLNLINLALKDAGVLGVGMTALAEDINDAFTRLNLMISEWQRKRWLIWHLVDVSKVSTGVQSYTVGPGGDFNVAVRPDRLEAAFLRQLVQSQPNQIDYPLEIIQSREDYNDIALKGLVSFPSYVFYDSTYNANLQGVVYPWPVPNASIYEVHLSLKDVIARFTSLGQTIVLPPEYESAIHYCLAQRLIPAYGLPKNDAVDGMARNALNTIRGANFQIGRLSIPTDLVRPGIYNPYSDQIR